MSVYNARGSAVCVKRLRTGEGAGGGGDGRGRKINLRVVFRPRKNDEGRVAGRSLAARSFLMSVLEVIIINYGSSCVFRMLARG